MDFLATMVRTLDEFSERTGRVVSWLTLVTVLVCCTVVILRYFFNIGILWLQESYIWAHAFVFMLGAAFTLKENGHVRVDLIYGQMDGRKRAWVNIFGVFVFLVPWIGGLLFLSLPFVTESWRIQEISPQPGGIEFVYILKTAIPLFCVLILLQAASLVGRSVLYLNGRTEFEPPGGGH